MSYDSLEVIYIISDVFLLIQTITSAIMCIVGYKWANKLIAIMSGYIGITLGVVITGLLLNSGSGLWSLWIVPICYFAFMWAAYKIVWLNHFCVGYLIATKITYMILYVLIEQGTVEASIGIILGAPIVIGLIAGFLISGIYNNYVLLLFISYLGATELISKVVSIANKGLFVTTGDISFIFDLEGFILGLFGVDTISLLEVIGILALGILSFLWQKKLAISNGIDLSDVIIDDRNYHGK